MAHLGEKLIILNEILEGLLTRTHYLLNFERPDALNIDVEKVCQKIVRKFPESNVEGIEKVQGYNIFTDRSVEIMASLEDYYQHILVLSKFKSQALALLHEISSKILEFSFETNQELLIRYFDLFTGHIQLILLAEKLPNCSDYVSLYSHAYEICKTSNEPNWTAVKTYVLGLDVPLRLIREELEPLGYHLGQVFQNISEMYMTYTSVHYLRDNSAFNVLESPQQLGIADEDGFYQNIRIANKIKTWVLYGFLACPKELQSEPLRALLKYALKDSLTIPIYRDVSLKVYDEFNKLFDEFRVKKFKLSNHKEILKSALKSLYGEAPELHAMKRNILRAELRNLLAIVHDIPGLLGPKIELIYSAMTQCRDELLWYFSHYNTDVIRSKLRTKESDSEDQIFELIYIVDQLYFSILEHHDLVKDYLLEYIKSSLSSLQPLIEDLLETNSTSDEIKQSIRDLFASVKTCNEATNFSQLRKEWSCLLAVISQANGGLSSKTAKAFMHQMSRIMDLSASIDDIDGQLRIHGTLHLLWFYFSDIAQMFIRCLSVSSSKPRHVVTLLRFLNFAQNNCHRFCPEEQAFIGKTIVSQAEKFLVNIRRYFIGQIEMLISNFSQLQNLVLPQEAAKRVVDAMNESFIPPPAGYESLHESRSSILELSRCHQSIVDICTALRETPIITVFNFKFSPIEYIYDELTVFFQAQVSKVTLDSNTVWDRPSVMLVKLNALITTFQIIASHLNADVNEFIRHILLNEVYEPSVKSVGVPIDIMANSLEDSNENQGSFLYRLSSLFLSALDLAISKPGILISDINMGLAYPTIESSYELSIVQFIQTPELGYLCQFLGPYGIRYISRKLLNSIFTSIKTIKDILEANKTLLVQISCRLNQTNVWSEGYKKLRNYDKMFPALMRISMALKFRSFLMQAQEEVIEGKFSTLHAFIKNIDSRLKPDMFSPDHRALFSIANDCGICDIVSDVGLLSLLRNFKATKADDEVFQLLPELLGFYFISREWRGSGFNVHYHAQSNNGHILVEGIRSLIEGFGCILTDADLNSPPTPLEIQRRTSVQLKKFVKFSAYCLLHMQIQHIEAQSAGKSSDDSWAGYDFSSMQLNLSHFISKVPQLDMSDLEDFFPFTSLRTTNIHLSEKQTVSGREYLMMLYQEEKHDEKVM